MFDPMSVEKIMMMAIMVMMMMLQRLMIMFDPMSALKMIHKSV